MVSARLAFGWRLGAQSADPDRADDLAISFRAIHDSVCGWCRFCGALYCFSAEIPKIMGGDNGFSFGAFACVRYFRCADVRVPAAGIPFYPAIRWRSWVAQWQCRT